MAKGKKDPKKQKKQKNGKIAKKQDYLVEKPSQYIGITTDSTDNYGSEAKTIKRKIYERELRRLQVELVKLQEWIKYKGLKVVVIFEGRDAAGKGGVIKRITESLNPRVCRVAALGKPTEKEKTQWYFQRYAAHLPAAGEMVLFDRSWYNRAGVERVMGFCSHQEYVEFLRSCPVCRTRCRASPGMGKEWNSHATTTHGRLLQAVCLQCDCVLARGRACHFASSRRTGGTYQ